MGNCVHGHDNNLEGTGTLDTYYDVGPLSATGQCVGLGPYAR